MNTIFFIMLIIVKMEGLTTHECSEANSCRGVVLDGIILCSGTDSCEDAILSGNIFCSGINSCTSAKIYGFADCAAINACANAYINGNANCESFTNTCANAMITGNVCCIGNNACANANIGGNACCDANNACANANINGDARCSTSTSCRNANILGSQFTIEHVHCAERCLQHPTPIDTTPSPTKEPCKPSTKRMNILFLIDESGSINNGEGNEDNYDESIDFVINLIENGINSASKVGAISFANVNQLLHGFDDSQDNREDIINALENEKNNYIAQWTNTYNALRGAAYEFTSNYISKNDKNIVFLLTDGIPRCPNSIIDPDCRIDVCNGELVNIFSAAGIDLYIIGVTSGFDETKLNCLVDETQEQKIFLIDDFSKASFQQVEGDIYNNVLCDHETITTLLPQ